MSYYYNNTFASTKTVFSEIGARQVKQLPIKNIDLKKESEKEIHDKIVKLVDKLQELSKHLENNAIKIEATDLELDKLICKLYGVPLTAIS